MTCMDHDASIPKETIDGWNGAHTCGFGPLDGNYIRFAVAADPRQQASNQQIPIYL